MGRNKRAVSTESQGSHRTALAIVRDYFPQVNRVDDAEAPAIVEVTPHDNRSGRVKNHQACAMAIACKRDMAADGVIVALTVAYVVKGDRAIRYELPESVSREVISFDRESKIGFAAGTYRMNVPVHKLGEERPQQPRPKSNASGSNGASDAKPARPRFIHRTAGIRVLGSLVKTARR